MIGQRRIVQDRIGKEMTGEERRGKGGEMEGVGRKGNERGRRGKVRK